MPDDPTSSGDGEDPWLLLVSLLLLVLRRLADLWLAEVGGPTHVTTRGGPESSSELGPSPEASVDWAARFSHELELIAGLHHGERPPRVVLSDEVPNVGANGEVVIVNPGWVQRVSDAICGAQQECQRDLVRGIAGHEWGHVVSARRAREPIEPSHARELEADQMAGWVLEATGGSVLPLLRLLAGEPIEQPSSTHPAASERMDAVVAGQQAHQRCRGQGSCRCDPPTP